MSDLVILKVVSSRENYDRFIKYINNVSKEVSVILKDMGKYFSTSTHTDIKWDLFAAWFKFSEHPTMKPEVMDVYERIFSDVDVMDYDDDDLQGIVHRFIDRSVSEDIAEVALAISDGDTSHSMDEIRELIESRDAKLKLKDDDSYAQWGSPITDVEGTLDWRLNELNAACGKLGKGDFIIIGARPDAGKTSFLASEVTHFAKQLASDECILWLNNEERLSKVQMRILCSALGQPQEWIESDWTRAYAAYCKAINGDEGKIILRDISGAYISQVSSIIKRHKPSVVVFDQLRKIHGYEREAGNETSRQEMVFNWARDVAKEWGAVLAVHQADGTAEGQQWIDMSQLHMSKTGIQGEADAIITIGRTPDKPTTRYIHIPKNKMRGSMPEHRNGKFEVELDGAIARFNGAM